MKKILFATIEAGSGHTMPAVAVHESLQELFPGKYDLRIMDFMREVGCTELDALHKSVWRYLLAHPRLTKSIQTLDIITGPLTMWMYRQRGEPFVEKVIQYLNKEKPDLIFCTHYFNSRALSIARRGEGVGPLERMLSALAQSRLDLNVLVVCGRNIELYKQLASRYASCWRPRIVPLGFIKNIQELIFLADFCFIKPGPATTWEAVSFHKPLILPKSAHLLENKNIAFIRSHGLGLYIGNSPRKLVQVMQMMMDSQILQRFSANYDKLDINNGADAIALFLDRLL